MPGQDKSVAGTALTVLAVFALLAVLVGTLVWHTADAIDCIVWITATLCGFVLGLMYEGPRRDFWWRKSARKNTTIWSNGQHYRVEKIEQ